MFTGLVEALGRLSHLQDGRLAIDCPSLAPALALGDSVAVNGICLTVARLEGSLAWFDFAQATRQRTTVGRWRVGDRLNLERALTLGSRLGGHLVQGHVDGTAEVLGVEGGDGVRFRVRLPQELRRYVVPRGSVTLDGVSLTAAELDGQDLTAVLVPHTWRQVCLSDRRAGDWVNVEVDVLAKYVESLLSPSRPAGGSADAPSQLSWERLAEWGYA